MLEYTCKTDSTINGLSLADQDVRDDQQPRLCLSTSPTSQLCNPCCRSEILKLVGD